MGALSVSGIPSFSRLFEPLVPDIVHVPFGEIDAIEAKMTTDTAAVILEPVQHEAGIYTPPPAYFRAVRKLCDENDAIFILDEVKTGLGKTGRMFACEWLDVVPDVLVLGKSLGGGVVPVGAIVAERQHWRKFSLSFSMSASSYAGNALACRAALTTIRVLQQGELIRECREKGRVICDGIDACRRRFPYLVKSVKGSGLLIGVEFSDPKKAIQLAREMVRRGVIMVPAFGNSSVLMIEPPLVILPDQINRVVEAFSSACEKINREEKADLS
jgi:putrescine aminotransferase